MTKSVNYIRLTTVVVPSTGVPHHAQFPINNSILAKGDILVSETKILDGM